MHQHEKKLAQCPPNDRACVATALLATPAALHEPHIPACSMNGGSRCAMDGALTRRTARKRACDTRKQHTLSNRHEHGGLTAPIRSPIPISVTPAVASMRMVSAGTTVSTWRVVMGVRWVSSCGRWIPECECSRAGSARTATGEATSSTPCRRISLPMCSRLPLECEEPLFTVAETEAAYTCGRHDKSHASDTDERVHRLSDMRPSSPSAVA